MKKILLIDDDEVFNFLNRSIIESAEFEGEIESCKSASSAISVLLDNKGGNPGQPDIIFLDLQMPVMDGFDFLDEFEKMPAGIVGGIKIAMLTSSINENDKKRSMSYKSVIDFIPKPLCEDKIWELQQRF